MVLSFRPALHQPVPVRTLQCGGHYQHPFPGSVGFSSNHRHLINPFLTRWPDFLGSTGRNKQVGEMLTTLFRTLKEDTSGTSAVEYGLIVSLIVVGMLVSMQLVATETVALWDTVETNALNAMGA